MSEAQLVTFDGKEVKFRVNSDCQTFWRNGVQHTVWRDGRIQRFDKRMCSVKVREAFEEHGIEQRLADSATGVDPDKITDKRLRLQARYDLRQRLIDHYQSGTDDWSPKARAAGGVDTGLVIRALIALGYAATPEECEPLFEGMGEGDRETGVKLLAGAGDVARKMSELKLADRPTTVSAADMLAALKAKKPAGEAPF